MQTIVELPEYSRKATDLLNNTEKQGIIDYLAAHPESGDLMQGTAGVRKFRWASSNRGKSGGVRVIYYFHNKTMPLFLLTVFGKNQKTNLSKAERNELAKFVNILINNYGESNV